MPYKRRYKKKKYNRKKGMYKARGKFKGAAPYSLINSGPKVIPDRMFTKITYTSTYNYTNGIGLIGDATLRGNSIFDPEVVLGGNQPIGFDEWSFLYNRYTVVGSKCKFTCVNTNVNAAVMTLVPLLSQTSLSQPEQASSLPRSKSRLLAPGGSGDALHSIQMYISSAEMFGKPRSAILDERDYSSLISGDPVAQWFYHPVVEPVLTGAAVSVSIQVITTYYVIFHDRVTLQVS